MLETIKAVFLLTAVFIGLCVGFMGPILGLATWADATACRSKAGAMGKPYTWGPLQGCMIQVRPGFWLPLENYRGIE